jgi:hypothetical protein
MNPGRKDALIFKGLFGGIRWAEALTELGVNAFLPSFISVSFRGVYASLQVLPQSSVNRQQSLHLKNFPKCFG